jgi:hypothetical protein
MKLSLTTRPGILRAALAGAGALALTAGGTGIASAAVTTTSAVSTTTSAVATTSTPVDERCDRPLPGVVLGDPGVHAGDASGLRVWHDTSGWHVRGTHPGHEKVTFSGVVRSGQPISAHGYRLESSDRFRVYDGGHTLVFAFANYGAVDGIDFTDACAVHTSFSLQRQGHELSPVAVRLGRHGVHPTGNPFLIQRH